MLSNRLKVASIVSVIAATAAMPACQPRDLPRVDPAASNAVVPTSSASPARRSPTLDPATPRPAEPPGMACASLRDVSDSDVVRVDKQTLYYADSTAGLVIVDVTDSSVPRQIALVPFVGTPTALFVREGIAWVMFVDADSRFLEGKTATVIRAIDVTNPRAPRLLGQEVRAGASSLARLVGPYLYVLSSTRSGGSVVESFDARDGALRTLDEVRLEGAPAQLAASSSGLAAVTLGDDHIKVGWLDLSMARPGAIALRETVRLPGGVATWEHGEGRIVNADEGQRVRVITCATRSCGPTEPTTLHVVDFGGSTKPTGQPGARVRGSLRLTTEGGLPLTRFTDDGLYVAEAALASRDTTNLRVVRTEDSGASRFVGHVALRGMLSGLVPREGALVAIGTVGAPGAPVNVILHDVDVRQPGRPRVRASATFGSDWTWSVALDDERALSFDPSSPLVAIPFTAWRKSDRRSVTGTQVLALGGTPSPSSSATESEGTVERAVFLDGHLVTVGPMGIRAIDYAAARRPGLPGGEMSLPGSSR